MPCPPPPRVLNRRQKWESPHPHGRRLWSMITHRSFASRQNTQCMTVGAGCAQCVVSTPPSARKHAHVKTDPIAERLFNQVAVISFTFRSLVAKTPHGPSFYGLHPPHSRVDPPIRPPVNGPARELNERHASSFVLDLQCPSCVHAPQTVWWSHMFVLGPNEGMFSDTRAAGALIVLHMV